MKKQKNLKIIIIEVKIHNKSSFLERKIIIFKITFLDHNKCQMLKKKNLKIKNKIQSRIIKLVILFIYKFMFFNNFSLHLALDY